MTNKKISCFLFSFIAMLLTQDIIAQGQIYNSSQIISNPMNISYRFQFKAPSRRETADPVIEYYKGKYYLFASHSSGYWSSLDLKDWDYIRCNTIETINEFAPAILVTDDALYFMATGKKARIYKNANPDIDQWEEVDVKSDLDVGDPGFFKDDDGRVYLYWGLSNSAPIRGVEVDLNDGFRKIGKDIDLIIHDDKIKGWEVPGINNDKTEKAGWNEGPTMIKVDGLYYLQYAAPGTEFDIYANSCYISSSPLGPFTCMPDNPFSIKPRGFINSAGHGHTFRDKYGNFWHVSSMLIGIREAYERRVGLFPTFFDNGYMHSRTVFTDYPFILPDKKNDFSKEDLSTGFNLLSRNKTATASSSKSGFEPSKAADEYVKTWWAAASGNVGEWFQMDLGTQKRINAVQVAFADEGFNARRDDINIPVYRYSVSYSIDGNNWLALIDRSQNTKDQIYEMIMLENPVYARYVKVENKGKFDVGNFSIADLRIFGSAEGNIPEDVTGLEVTRNENDYRRISFKWNSLTEAGTGYVLRWGSKPDRINNAVIVYDNKEEFGFFHKEQSYYFTIQAFNESGKGNISEPVFCAGKLFEPFDFTQKAKSITSSLPEGADLSPLTDKNAETSINIPLSTDTWFMFEMPAAFIPTGYSIIVNNSNEENSNPLSWKLQSSRSGNPDSRWTDVDTRTNQTFFDLSSKLLKISASSNMYFRLLIQANNEQEILHLTGFQLFGHLVTPEISLMNTGGTITAEFPGTGSPWNETIDKAVDKSFGTKYCADGHTTGWVQYELQEAAIVDRYAITCSEGSNRDPKNWELLGSPNGSRWRVLDTRSNEDFLTDFSTMEYTIKNTDKYKYYRLKVTKNNGNDNFFELAEWQLFAATPSSIGEQKTMNSSIFIYPNPPKYVFSINCEQQPESVEILNAEGKIIKTFDQSSFNSYNVSNIPAGIYFVRIETDKYNIIKFAK